MHLFDHTSRWLAFVAVAIATSYALRWLAARASRAGERGVASARRTLGLSERAALQDRRPSATRDAPDAADADRRVTRP